MKLLSRAEEIILLAIVSLEGDAYGLSTQDFIREATGTEWSLARLSSPNFRRSGPLSGSTMGHRIVS